MHRAESNTWNPLNWWFIVGSWSLAKRPIFLSELRKIGRQLLSREFKLKDRLDESIKDAADEFVFFVFFGFHWHACPLFWLEPSSTSTSCPYLPRLIHWSSTPQLYLWFTYWKYLIVIFILFYLIVEYSPYLHTINQLGFNYNVIIDNYIRKESVI